MENKGAGNVGQCRVFYNIEKSYHVTAHPVFPVFDTRLISFLT